MAWDHSRYPPNRCRFKPWEFFDEEDLRTTVQRTHDAIERAEELAPHASPVEQALIGALRHRYTVDAEGADFLRHQYRCSGQHTTTEGEEDKP